MVDYVLDGRLAALMQNNVHARSEGDQETPAIARLNDGGFVAAWASHRSVVVQRFDAAGQPVGGEQLIASNGASFPVVAGLASGGFAVSWAASDGGHDGIWARSFDAAGAAIGPAFAVNAETFGNQAQPTLRGLPNGDLIIAWSDNGTNGIGNIRARIFSPDGIPATGDIVVTSSSFAASYDPNLAVQADGDFVIAWTGPKDNSFTEANAMAFSSAGTPIGGGFSSLQTAPGPDFHEGFWTSIATLASGEMIMTWTDRSPTVPQVKAQRLDAAGNAIGDAFVISSSDVASGQASVAALDNGGFIVTWQEDTPSAGVNYFQRGDLHAQIYDADGVALGEPLSVATTTDLAQDWPGVVQFGTGDFAFIWRNFVGPGESDVAVRTFYSVTSGTNDDDVISGSALVDALRGLDGADTLHGLDGADILEGGAGDDRLDGGSGVDLAIFSGARSDYDLVNLGAGRFRVSGPDGTDLTSGVEQLQFGEGTFAVPDTFFAQPEFLAPIFGASPAAGSWTNSNTHPRTLGDINGDGRADLVGFGNDGVYAALAAGDGTFGGMYLATNTFGASPAGGSWTSAGVYPRTLADINGDGAADLIGFGNAGVYASLSNGDGSFGELYLATNMFGAWESAGSWTSADLHPRTLGDVNGDGMADLVGFGNNGVYVALATGGGAFGGMYLGTNTFGASPAGGSWTSAAVYPRTLADINGDGAHDLVGFGNAGVYASLSNGDGSFGELYLAAGVFGAAAQGGGWTSADRYPRGFADINGDGFDDIIGFGNLGAYVAPSNGDGSFAPTHFDSGYFGAAGADSWPSDSLAPRAFGDVNGDGMADIVGFGSEGVQIAIASEIMLV